MSATKVVVQAPAKIILSGEHAVVYGAPALAMTINRYATTTIVTNSAKQFTFILPDLGQEETVSIRELQTLRSDIEARYQQFSHGVCQIKDLFTSPAELLEYTLSYCLSQLGLDVTTGLQITVTANIPLGCGMGSSAAAILGLIYALAYYYDRQQSAEHYLAIGRHIENLQHGYSSGIDLFLSLHGGCYLFEAGIGSKKSMPQLPLLLVNTGKPLTTTGECVQHVASHFRDSYLADDFAEITLTLEVALAQSNSVAVRQCIKENNNLLKYIGVVPAKVAAFIAAIEARGGAAKISGAGATHGDCAGMVLIAGTNDYSDLLEEYGYKLMPLIGEPNGVGLI